MAVEQIELIVGNRQALAALLELNRAVQNTEGGVEVANAKLQSSVDKVSQFIVQSTDKATKSLIRHTEQIERNAVAYGKTPIEKLNALRDAEIKKIQQSSVSLTQQAAAIQVVTASYEKMIAIETLASTSATASMRQTMQMESALEKGSVNSNRAAASFLLSINGIGPAVAAAFSVFGLVAFGSMLITIGENFGKFWKDAEDAAKKSREAFQSVELQVRKSNTELELTDVKITNAIAKLEHRPENKVLQAALEATKAFEDLGEKIQHDIDLIEKDIKNNGIGLAASLLTGQARTGPEEESVQRFKGQITNIQYKQATGKLSPEEASKAISEEITNQQTILERLLDQEKRVQMKRQDILNEIKNAGPLSVQALAVQSLAYPDQTALMTKQKGEYTTLQQMQQSIALTGKVAEDKTTLDKLQGNKAGQEATEQLRREVAKAQEGELSGLDKIKAAHDERIRQLQHEGQATTLNKKLVQDIADAETKRFKDQQIRLDAQTNTTASRAVEEANVRANYALFNANRRGGDTGPDDIKAAKDYAIEEASRHHTQAIEDIALMKEEDRGRARKLADNQQTISLKEAENKAEVDTIKYLQQQDELKRKSHLEEVDHQQRMMDLTTTANDRAAREADQHQTRMRGILAPLHGTSLSRQIQGVQTDLGVMTAGANATYESKERDIEFKQAQDQAELANATGKDKETWQKKLDSLEDEHIKNVGEQRKEIDELRYAAEEKIAQLQMKQFEEIKSKTEGLLHTLFTNPTGFGKQLETTVRDAALKPIEDKLSTGIASEIYKVMHHGQMPGSKLADLKVGTVDDSMKVHVTNMPGTFEARSHGTDSAPTPGSAAASMRSLMSLPSMGGGFSPLLAGGFSALSGGFSPFSGGGGGYGGGFSPASGGGWTPTQESTSETIDYGGGAQSLGGSTRALPPIGGASIGGVLGTLLGGSKGQGGISRMLGNLKGNLGGFTRSGGMDAGQDAQGNDTTSGGKITGVNGIAGALLGAGGQALAERGLLGNDRGTGRGVAEGAGGGAMIGMQQGGPLGAVIGGAAGALIGLGEMAAGVESPRNQAKRLVKARYGLDINNAVADQIAELAKSKYANNVSMAVMSPEVRQMLMLQAAASGHTMPVGSTTPHAASFSEQSGHLSQEATYIYGQAFTYQSNVPVAGGIPTQNYSGGTNQAPIYLAMHASGQDLASFMTGSYVTPDFVQDQWSSAQDQSNGRLQNSATMMNPGLRV